MNPNQLHFKEVFAKKIVALSRVFLFVSLISLTQVSTAQELKMYSGINLVMDGTIQMVVNNTAFKNDGTFTAGAGTVKFSGSTDTTLSYVSGSSYTRFNNLTLDKTSYGIAIKSSVGVKNILTVANGYLYTDSNLTLLSDITNTARLATVPSSGAFIVGKAMVERYIPSKRAWRLMTAPVTSGSSFYKSWQNDGVYTVGKGLLISSPGAGNGLDNGNTTSLKAWNTATQAFTAITNTYASTTTRNNGSADNDGYFVFIRGDRNPNNFIVPNTNITTITSIGKLQTGNQVFNASPVANTYTLIGNPYASPIDFNMVTRTNLLKRFYVWDPTLNTLGGYVTLDDLDNNGVYTKSVSISAQTKEIQSSQAFFVQTNTTGTATLTIGESAKSTTNNTAVFRPFNVTGSGPGSLSANLFLVNTDSSLILADGVLVEFSSEYHDSVTNEDAIKFTNTNENLALSRYGSLLAIERRPEIQINDTLFFRLWKTTPRSYKIRITPVNIYQPGMKALFEDSYLKTSTPISMLDTTDLDFAIDGNAASAATDRFRLVFNPATVLPISFLSVKGYLMGDEINVDWKAQDEVNIVKYKVQRSANGVDFKDLGTADKNITGVYSVLDVTPFAGKNFYRIQSIDRQGATKYSQVVLVQAETGASHFTVAPNPIKGHNIYLHYSNQAKGLYRFNLLNSEGSLVFSSQEMISNGSNSKLLNTGKSMAAGIYQLQIAKPNGNVETQKVIIGE